MSGSEEESAEHFGSRSLLHGEENRFCSAPLSHQNSLFLTLILNMLRFDQEMMEQKNTRLRWKLQKPRRRKKQRRVKKIGAVNGRKPSERCVSLSHTHTAFHFSLSHTHTPSKDHL